MRTLDSQLRRVVFRPYRKGAGPVFALTTWQTGRYDNRGQEYQRYRLTMNGKPLFDGEDYSPSPMDASDSDATVAGLMGFLCVRPGDTDAEYFKDYTPAQLAFCDEHAEALSCAVDARFCDENGNVRR